MVISSLCLRSGGFILQPSQDKQVNKKAEIKDRKNVLLKVKVMIVKDELDNNEHDKGLPYWENPLPKQKKYKDYIVYGILGVLFLVAML